MSKKVYRSSVTGLFVSEAFASRNPNETSSEQHLETPINLDWFVLVTTRESANKMSMNYFKTLAALKIRLDRFKKSDKTKLKAYRILYQNLHLSQSKCIADVPVIIDAANNSPSNIANCK